MVNGGQPLQLSKERQSEYQTTDGLGKSRQEKTFEAPESTWDAIC